MTIAAGTPLSVTSPQTMPTRPVRQLDEVVEIAADHAGRPVVRGDLPTRQVGELLGQVVLLDQRRDSQLLLDSLPGPHLGLLPPHELADPDRRRRLGRELVEELPVVARVLLLGQARPQVEHPDELALAHERDHELHPRLPADRPGPASPAPSVLESTAPAALWK